MVTTKEKYLCPVCGEMISAQGVAGHNRSKKHLAALEKQQQEQHEEQQHDQIEDTQVGDETGTTRTDTGTERDEPFRFFQ